MKLGYAWNSQLVRLFGSLKEQNTQNSKKVKEKQKIRTVSVEFCIFGPKPKLGFCKFKLMLLFHDENIV